MNSPEPLFVDANVFVRYLAQDHPEHSPRATAFIEQAARGAIDITTSESVLAEIVFILTSPRLPYRLDRPTMCRVLRAILQLEGMRLTPAIRTTYLNAVQAYEEHRVDFTDALSIAHVVGRRTQTIVSFDRDFDREPRITRVEP